MRKLFTVFLVLTLFVLGIGFYRGSFTLTSPISRTTSHAIHIKLTLDPDKVKADAKSVKQ